jgi:hypothetical protein
MYPKRIHYWNKVNVLRIEVYCLKYMSVKGVCKNCGDNISEDSNSDEFCSEQCGVEYQMEHNRK